MVQYGYRRTIWNELPEIRNFYELHKFRNSRSLLVGLRGRKRNGTRKISRPRIAQLIRPTASRKSTSRPHLSITWMKTSCSLLCRSCSSSNRRRSSSSSSKEALTLTTLPQGHNTVPSHRVSSTIVP